MAVLQDADPGFALMQGTDLWVRASFEDLALVGGVVQLAWDDVPEASAEVQSAPARGGGLAFDGHCRLYHSLSAAGGLERLLWAAHDPLAPSHPGPAPVPLLAAVDPPLGDFAPVSPAQALARPRGLAVDADDRLYVALNGARAVLVLDLWERRILRRLPLPGRPLDLASMPDGRAILAVTEDPLGLHRLTARHAVRALPLPDGLVGPLRIAVAPDGTPWLLVAAATAAARVLEVAPTARTEAVPWATDLVFYRPAARGGAPETAPGTTGVGAASGAESGIKRITTLVVARRPGETFRRFRPGAAGLAEIPALAARGYDGLGIVATPDERIAFWSSAGLRYAVAARSTYRTRGRLIGFQLDSGDYQTQWGRLFLDACIPRDTRLGVTCIAADELPEGPRVVCSPPVNLQHPAIPHGELSPPLPATVQMPPDVPPEVSPDTSGNGNGSSPVHRRAEGSELPWLQPRPGDTFATYEAPATDIRGRFLWVILSFSGNGRATPRVRALRAEHPSHDLLTRLPRVLTREDPAASFLGRFLAPLAGLLADLDARARLRHALLDPVSAPAEALPWLAGMLGLVMDERWPEATRRAVIAALPQLFRFRGTIAGLKRFLHLVTGAEPIIVERWRMRGGAVVGEPEARGSRAVVGAGLRVGGEVGIEGETRLSAQSTADAFASHAHRFTVMLPALLSDASLELAAHVLELHRPAHTLYDLCTVTAGSRVGRGLHVGLSAVIGRGSGWVPIQVGAAALGRDGIIGRPRPGTSTNGARLGVATRVG